MSRRGEFKETTTPDVSSDSRTTRIGPRRVVATIPGQTQTLVIDPSDYAVRSLAAQLADAWVDLAERGAGTPRDQSTAIRVFLRSIDAQTEGRDIGLADLTLEHLNIWENELVAKQQANYTTTQHRYAIHLLAVLRWLADQPETVLSDEVRSRLSHGTRLEWVRRAGPDEFSESERLVLTKAAHRVVDQAIKTTAIESDSLIACHILLSAATGEPPEVIRSLHVDDITLDPVDPTLMGEHADALAIIGARIKQARVVFNKRRSHTQYDRAYDSWRARYAIVSTLRLTASLRASSGLRDLLVVKDRNNDIVRYEFNGSRSITLRRWIELEFPRKTGHIVKQLPLIVSGVVPMQVA